MTRYFPKDEISFNAEYKGSDGVLVNADTVAFSYRLNDETNATATPTNTATGKYAITLIPAKSGVLRVEWSFTKDGIKKITADQVKVWPSRVQAA